MDKIFTSLLPVKVYVFLSDIVGATFLKCVKLRTPQHLVAGTFPEIAHIIFNEIYGIEFNNISANQLYSKKL